MNPCLLSVMSIPSSMRLMLFDSLRTISTMAGSFSCCLAMFLANSDGTMSSRLTIVSSARDTTTCVTTSMSLFWIGVPCLVAASQISVPRLSPDFMIGIPSIPIT